jgi:hypothetical protein
MKSRDVVGRTIIEVKHERWYDRQAGGWKTTVSYIRLSDGSRLVPHAFETTMDPAADILIVKEGGKHANQ